MTRLHLTTLLATGITTAGVISHAPVSALASPPAAETKTVSAPRTFIYQLEETFENPALRMPPWQIERGDYELGNVTIQEKTVRAGSRAVSLVNRYTDPRPARERTEMVATKKGNIEWDQEYWIGFSFYLKDWTPSAFPEMVHQFHAIPHQYNWKNKSGRNLTSIRIENGVMEFHAITQPREGPATGGASADPVWSEAVRSNVWYDWVIHVRPSTTPNGLLEVWKNNELIYQQKGPNVDPFDSSGASAMPRHYLKAGIYNWHWVRAAPPDVTVREIIYDEIRMGHVEGGYTGGREGVTPGAAMEQTLVQ